MDNLIGSLKDAGLCKDVHYKELYIPQAELEGMESITCLSYLGQSASDLPAVLKPCSVCMLHCYCTTTPGTVVIAHDSKDHLF